jgi:ethanolamine ammonia-lyase small subunit
LDEENLNIIRTQLKKNPDVQIVIGEGQSSPAIETGLKELLPALIQGLEVNRINYGTPVYVENTRVAIGDLIAEETGAKMVCVILGERPGLLCWTGLACYLTYAPEVGMTDESRNAITMIQESGIPPAEAGAYIADVIKRILQEKKSGTELVL